MIGHNMACVGTDVGLAVEILNSGGLVGIPTETVYGLAGRALDVSAVRRIYEVKNRPVYDPLIVHVDCVDRLGEVVVGVPDGARRLARRFWPGPLTLLLPKLAGVSDVLTAGLERVAVRVPDHPLALSLLGRVDGPLAVPSANPFGYVSPTEAVHVYDQLGDKIDYILDGGACRVGVESTIVGFEGGEPMVYRWGGVVKEDIERELGRVGLCSDGGISPSAPGMLEAHYAPRVRLVIGDIAHYLGVFRGKRVGVVSFTRFYDVGRGRLFVLSPGGDMGEAARNLFKALRYMDRQGVEVILSEYFPEWGLGRAINDRLRRASSVG